MTAFMSSARTVTAFKAVQNDELQVSGVFSRDSLQADQLPAFQPVT
jgi:hypothetical protein